MAWKIEYLSPSLKQLEKIDPQMARRIVRYMHERIARDDPYSQGKALTGNWVGFWRYRVGDYRIICKLRDQVLTVTVVQVGHRSDVYK